MRLLDKLNYKAGSKRGKKKVGRGTGSGHGKTCGRGHKGQKSRSGGTKGNRFEGGQTPLYRRLPKRGFKNYPFRKFYQIINVGELEKMSGEVNKKILGMKENELLKILGSGKITKALNVHADQFSKTAKEKIEAAGGKCEM